MDPVADRSERWGRGGMRIDFGIVAVVAGEEHMGPAYRGIGTDLQAAWRMNHLGKQTMSLVMLLAVWCQVYS